LLVAAHARAVAGSGTWWAIDEARGENSIRSPPRSRRIRSWFALHALPDHGVDTQPFGQVEPEGVPCRASHDHQRGTGLLSDEERLRVHSPVGAADPEHLVGHRPQCPF
jgi:hypothetical protein